MAQRAKSTGNRVVTLGETLDGVSEDMQTLPQQDDDLYDQDDDEIELQNDVERVLADVGAGSSDSMINIYRADPDNRKADSFLFDVRPKEFSLPFILQNYGGGTYRIRGYMKKPEGGVKLFVNRIITLEQPKISIPALPPQQDLTPILSAIQEQGRQMQTILASVIQQKPVESRMDFFKELAVIKELLVPAPQPQQQQSSMADSLALIKTVMEMKEMMGGEGTSPLTTIGMRLLDKLGDMQKLTQPPAQIPNQNNAPIGLPQPNPISAPPKSEEEMQAIQAVNMIIIAAEQNADTDEWATLVYENADDNMLNLLISDPDWFAKIATIDPRISHHAKWFTTVREKIVAIYREETLTAPDPVSQTDDATTKTASNVPITTK